MKLGLIITATILLIAFFAKGNSNHSESIKDSPKYEPILNLSQQTSVPVVTFPSEMSVQGTSNWIPTSNGT